MTIVEQLVAYVGVLAKVRKPLVLGIDGRSGVGKSTIARVLGDQVGAAVIVGDDFYAGGTSEDWARRSNAEKAGTVIDWRRIREEALKPLIAGRIAEWHPFDWKTGIGLSNDSITCAPADIIILDGAYSCRPELADVLDLTILIRLDDSVRRARLREREGYESMKEWHPIWDAAEDYYFSSIRPPSSFDLVFDQPIGAAAVRKTNFLT